MAPLAAASSLCQLSQWVDQSGSRGSPLEGEGGVTEAVSKAEDRSACVELVGSSRWGSHAHIEEGDLVHVVGWVLGRGEYHMEAYFVERCSSLTMV